MKWYQITLSYLCAGFAVSDGRIVQAAPIIKWGIGKPLSTMQAYATRKGGVVAELPEHPAK